MAKRRKGRTSTVRVVRASAPRSAAAPIIKIAQPRAPVAHRRRRSGVRRSRRSSGGLIGSAMSSGVSDAIGGALYGFAVKQGWVAKLPPIPLVGRTGTAAILLHYLARRGGGEYVKRAAVAAAVIAGYQLGSTGAILGSGASADDSYADGDDDSE